MANRDGLTTVLTYFDKIVKIGKFDSKCQSVWFRNRTEFKFRTKLHNIQPQTAPDLRVAPYMTAASFSTKPASFNTEPLPALKRTFPSRCSAASKQAARANGGAGTPALDHPRSGAWPFSSTDTAAFSAVVSAVMYGPRSDRLIDVEMVPAPPWTATAQLPGGFVVMLILSKTTINGRNDDEAQWLESFSVQIME